MGVQSSSYPQTAVEGKRLRSEANVNGLIKVVCYSDELMDIEPSVSPSVGIDRLDHPKNELEPPQGSPTLPSQSLGICSVLCPLRYSNCTSVGSAPILPDHRREDLESQSSDLAMPGNSTFSVLPTLQIHSKILTQ